MLWEYVGYLFVKQPSLIPHLFAVDDEVIVSEGEPALCEVVVSRLVIVGQFGDGRLCHLP